MKSDIMLDSEGLSSLFGAFCKSGMEGRAKVGGLALRVEALEESLSRLEQSTRTKLNMCLQSEIDGPGRSRWSRSRRS